MKENISEHTRIIDNTVNKLKIYLLVAFLFLGVSIINAQDNYYYYKAKKVPLTLDKRSLNISVFKNFNKPSLTELNLEKNDLQISKTDIDEQIIGYKKIEYESTLSDAEFHQKLESLKKTKNIRTVSPNFITENGKKLGMSDYFYVKLKRASDFEKLHQLAKEKNIRIIEQNEFMPLWYTLRCTEKTTGNTLEIANSFFETGWLASSSPDFLTEDYIVFNSRANQNFNQLREAKTSSNTDLCANDRFFALQWGLKKTHNADIDIDACQAWEVTEGNGVQVAVLDSGIDLVHEDLVDNISPLSYDTETNSSPSQVYYNDNSRNNHHGTSVVGVIGAIKDNDIGIAGIAPQSTLISISNSFTRTPDSRMKIADGINWAWLNGADIINNSWFSSVQSDAIDDAINNALTQGRDGKGSVVVFSVGNHGDETVLYPASSNPNIIAVGGANASGKRFSFSNYGDELDIVAPASSIISTLLNNKYGLIASGNSMATAYVSGVVALILSVNPSLTVLEVHNILEQTAEKVGGYDYITHENRPNGPWNDEMGYGLVDAYAAVLMAKKYNSLDLYIKDFSDDRGIEPNRIKGKMWRSPDIWVRNTLDGIEQHQNPVYDPSDLNHVYVRVANRGTVSSTADEQINLYWSKAGTALTWPTSWHGTLYNEGVLMGAPIGIIDIPELAPGEEAVLSIPWQMPNPNDYININPSPWHFCFLARIVSDSDPMTIEETRWMSANARRNNNIAWKNVIAVKASSNSNTRKRGVEFDNTRSFGGVISVENPFDHARTYSLELVKENTEASKAISDEVEVAITMDQTLYNAWARGGNKSGLLKNTNNKRKKIITGNHAYLRNMQFEPNEIGMLNLTFNFLSSELTDKSELIYHVVQKDAETEKVVGGETYIINKDSRELIETRFNDYARVETKKNGNFTYNASLDKIIPNPVSNSARITYNLGGAKSAYLMLVGFYNGALKTTANYDLDSSSEEATLDLKHYTKGYYQITLICDGEIVDVKTLIKE